MQVEHRGVLKLLPPAEGKCRICAVDHEPHFPHDAASLFYQVRFRARYGRDGTWADAAAHCAAHMREAWRAMMEERGYKWTAPPEGVDAIAEPIDG